MNICCGCPHLVDLAGNYTECGLYAKEHAYEMGHIFVDYFYWEGGAPEECPLKVRQKENLELVKRYIKYISNETGTDYFKKG